MQHTDTLIIGAGFAGLAALNLLVDAGHHAVLLEKSVHIGGRAQGHTVGDFYANIGPRAIYRGGVAMRLLNEFGINPTGGIPPNASYGMLNGGVHPLPADMARLFKTGLLDVGDKVELAQKISIVRTIAPESVMDVPLGEWIDSTFHRPNLRLLWRMLARLNTYSGHSDNSAGAFLRQFQIGSKRGVLYADGGWEALAGKLASRARTKGATIHTGVHVTRVYRDGNDFVVDSDEGIWHAKQVILATRPNVAYELTEDETLYRWSHAVEPVELACLDIALTQLPYPNRLLIFGLDQPVYFSTHSHFANFGTKQGVLVHVAHYLPTDAHKDRAILEAFLDKAQPNWRKYLITSKFMPKMRVSQARPYPTEHITAQIPTMDGVYVVGDWVGRDTMLLDACFSSAESAVTDILQKVPMGETI
jgi:phytoene dehydrogenase-like protein